MGIAIPEKIKDLVDGRNFAHLATIMADGLPHSAPVWISRWLAKLPTTKY